MSWDILWSQQSGVLAMLNIFPYEQKPKRNLTLLLDPFAGKVLAHTYGHGGTNPNGYCFSPSGRFISSVFGCDYLDNQGAIIPAGTIAITDLASIASCVPAQESDD